MEWRVEIAANGGGKRARMERMTARAVGLQSPY
jgi:hypothetical protein